MATLAATDGRNAIDNLGFIAAAIKTQLGNISTSAIQGNLTTETTRIQALSDPLVNPVLGTAWEIEGSTTPIGNLPAGTMISWLANLVYSTFVNQKPPIDACDRLDYVCSQVSTYTGLYDWLVGNAVQIDQYSADVFNGWVTLVNNGGLPRRVGTQTPKAIPSSLVFPHANVDYVNQWAATGASTGNLTAGSTTLAAAIITGGNTAPGFGILEAYASGSIGASGYTITVTYTKNDGTTGQTMTFTITANATNGTVFTPSGSNNVASIQSVAVTAGSATSGDTIRFRLKPVRVIAA